MEITIEDEKSVNGSVVNRGTISMYKKVRSSKKIFFTPTQSSETSEHYYVLDEKAIPSFDTVLHKIEPIKIIDDFKRSSPMKIQNQTDLYDECWDLVNSFKKEKRKKRKDVIVDSEAKKFFNLQRG